LQKHPDIARRIQRVRSNPDSDDDAAWHNLISSKKCDGHRPPLH
jgi:hypothetical protein